MNRSVVFRLKGKRIVEIVNRNSSYIFLSAVYVLGVILGCLVVPEFSDVLFADYINIRSSSPFIKSVFLTLWSYIPFQLSCFLFGTSVVGSCFVPFIVLTKGYLTSSVCSYLYSTFILKGVAFNALIYVPVAVLSAMLLIVCADNAVRFSAFLFKATLPQGKGQINYLEFKKYCLKNLLLLGVLLICAVFDSVGTAFFVKLFNFTT